MKRLTLTLFVIALSLPLFAQSYTVPDPLTDKEIDAAIVLGKANKMKGIIQHCLAGVESKGGAFGAFGVAGLAIAAAQGNKNAYDVAVMAAKGRVATAAWEAAQANKPFTVADVPAEWRQPLLLVVVTKGMPPEDKKADAILPSPIKSFSVTIHADKNRQIAPSGELTFVPRTWKNISGATVDYKDATARFPIEFLPSVRTDDTAEFSVVTEAGTRSCKIAGDTLKELVRIK